MSDLYLVVGPTKKEAEPTGASDLLKHFELDTVYESYTTRSVSETFKPYVQHLPEVPSSAKRLSCRRSQSLKQLIEAEPGVILRLDDTHEVLPLPPLPLERVFSFPTPGLQRKPRRRHSSKQLATHAQH